MNPLPRETSPITSLDQLDPNLFLTTAEVAEIFRVDHTTVRRWVQKGALTATLLPTKGHRHIYRIRRTEIEKILGTFPAPQSDD